jgi:hypothetical protein
MKRARLAACAARGTPVDTRPASFRPSTYSASTLHLLVISALRRNNAECLPKTSTILSYLLQ